MSEMPPVEKREPQPARQRGSGVPGWITCAVIMVSLVVAAALACLTLIGPGNNEYLFRAILGQI